MKETWKPAWEVERRKPTFVGSDGPRTGQTRYGARKYLWGNVPAIDVMQVLQNEAADLPESLRLLFAGESCSDSNRGQFLTL